MDADDLRNGHYKALVQGSFIMAKHLSVDLRKTIQDSRAIPAYRAKLLLDTDMVIVLSQDCDIASDNEKYVEIIVAKKCKKKEGDSRVQKGRNSRKLQIPIDEHHWELEIMLIGNVPKQVLRDECRLGIDGVLAEREKNIFVQWRANRYARVPFPDRFNKAFIDRYVRPAESGFAAFLEERRDEIADLYLFVAPKDEEVDEYLVSITALLDHYCPAQSSENIQQWLMAFIKKLHEEDNGLRMIQIDGDKVPGEHYATLDIVARPEDFSMLDAMFLKRLNLDYLCWPEEEETATGASD